MAQRNPKFRSDLTIRPQETATGTSFVVKDAVSEQYFFLREAERFIALQLDGETPLEVVRQRTESEFGAALSPETLEGFVSRLEKVGMLDTGNRKETRGRTQGRLRGSFLYLRFKILDPSPFLGHLYDQVRFLFTPQFVILSATVILLAAGITVANWSEYTADLARLRHFAVIPLFMAVIFFVVSLHELAHALMCKHFSGEVREMGFLLIYFQPALYCDVSDAWLFPEKSKRLWVSFAGGYFELFLWGLATVAWRVTDESTWINYVALAVMTGSGIKTLLNFNPLIKLDGYYLLSDYLEIPNLRKKAFRYVGALTERLWWGGSAAQAPEGTPRERRIYLFYGLAATTGSFILLAYVLISTGTLLIEGGQPLLLFLLTGLVGTRFRKRLGKLFGKPGRLTESDDGEDFATPETSAPSYKQEQNVAGDPAATASRLEKKKKRRFTEPMQRRTLWLTLAGVTLALLFLGRMELRIAGAFNILPEENADIRAAVDGIVRELHVDEGVEVKAGQVIARLSDRSSHSELLKTEAEIRENQATLQKLVAGPTASEIELARAGVAKAEDQLKVSRAGVAKAESTLKYAQDRLPRFQQLYAENLTAKIELEQAQQQVLLAENELAEARGRLQVVTEELAEAQGRLNVLLAGTRPEEKDAIRARIERLEAQRRFLQDQVGMLEVVSPVDGVVATPSRQLKQMVRQFVKKGDLITKVYHFDTVTAHIQVSEKDIGVIRVGQRVILRARSYPSQDFEGKVTFIATSAQGVPASSEPTPLGAAGPSATAGGNKMVLVTTEIDNRSRLLKPEMTGQAKMYCGERRIIDLITRRLAQTIKVEFWSWW